LDGITNGTAFVCFRENEDAFIIVSFEQPKDTDFQKDPKTGAITFPGLASIRRFSKGLSDESKLLFGTWAKAYPTSDPTFVSTSKTSDNEVFIDRSELSISYSFTNLGKTKTNYSLQIRRSTLRFLETWQFPGNEKEKADTRTSGSGHCAAFGN
jgi:hypothetical protein